MSSLCEIFGEVNRGCLPAPYCLYIDTLAAMPTGIPCLMDDMTEFSKASYFALLAEDVVVRPAFPSPSLILNATTPHRLWPQKFAHQVANAMTGLDERSFGIDESGAIYGQSDKQARTGWNGASQSD